MRICFLYSPSSQSFRSTPSSFRRTKSPPGRLVEGCFILIFLAGFEEILFSIVPKIHSQVVEFLSIFTASTCRLSEIYLVMVIVPLFWLLIDDLASKEIMIFDRSNCLLLEDGSSELNQLHKLSWEVLHRPDMFNSSALAHLARLKIS